MHLPDVNVWLALTFDSHVHHPDAKAWFDVLPSDAVCYFCRHSQQGLLRLATNPSVFGQHALSLSEAWQTYDDFLSDQRIAFLDEPNDVERNWRNFTKSRLFSPKTWSDGYLAAFALSANLEMVTFDKGFSKFAGVNCRILLSSSP